MFTGIVRHLGIISENKNLPDGSILLIIKFNKINDESKTLEENWRFFYTIKIGDSVAINGICLTVVKINNDEKSLEFFVSQETIKNTTIMLLPKNRKVNVELAMSLGDKFDGHIVTGHIDEVIKLQSLTKAGDSFVLNFESSLKNSKLLVKKGSIAIDGVSLTINKVFKNTFEVCIIPHTWSNTIIQNLDPISNNFCNVEYDYFAKIIQKNLSLYNNNFNKS